MSKIVSLLTLQPIRERLRNEGKTVVLTNGCFDILHVGHVRYLQQARALGDCLIVGINSDQSVRLIKGSERPIVPEIERAEIIAALGCVDFVVIFAEHTAEKLVATLKPDIYVKGGDYSAARADETNANKDIPETQIVEAYGGKTLLLPFQRGHSTSSLIKTILERYRDK